MQFHSNPHPPFDHLEAAYQLHFYLFLKTRYKRDVFDPDRVRALLSDTLENVCNREDYHLLHSQFEPAYLRVLLSLKPTQTISRSEEHTLNSSH